MDITNVLTRVKDYPINAIIYLKNRIDVQLM